MTEKAECKFTHLLQPIRDLAANWDVNVAEELEDYLDELENIHFSLEDEGASAGLNFAEAALVIQGSASVYSKKVEYLHSLVYAAIEAIAQKRSSKQKDQRRNSGSACDDSEFGAEEQFLTLDDVAEGGPEIDMQEKEGSPPPMSVRPPVSLSLLGHCPGPISTSKFQAYAHRSGAILLDPADAVEPPAVPEGRDSRAQQSREPSEGHQEAEAGGFEEDDYTPASPGGLEAEAEEAGFSNAQQDLEPSGAAAMNTGSAGMCDEEEVFEDPYEPLELHVPGSLQEAPLKHRLPKKRVIAPKEEFSVSLARLIRAVPPDAVALPEFAGYLKQKQKAEAAEKLPATRRAAVGQAADHGGAQECEFDDDEDAGGRFEAGSDDGYEPAEAPLSPILGGDFPSFAEEQLVTAAMPLQNMFAEERHARGLFTTDLEERVRTWQQSIEPHLESQDMRPVFDIKQYGNRIIETFTAKVKGGEWSSFEVIAAHKEHWEVARLFASMLQLVNAGSINIAKS